jgi:transposase-like protein
MGRSRVFDGYGSPPFLRRQGGRARPGSPAESLATLCVFMLLGAGVLSALFAGAIAPHVRVRLWGILAAIAAMLLLTALFLPNLDVVRDPDPEVPERARGPRRYSASYKARILAEYERLDKPGKGALLRREGLYTSLISEWRKQRDRGALQALAKPAGRQPADPRDQQLARLRIVEQAVEPNRDGRFQLTEPKQGSMRTIALDEATFTALVNHIRLRQLGPNTCCSRAQAGATVGGGESSLPAMVHGAGSVLP